MKVLSIDFDIIMKPSINAYNNLIDGTNPDMNINKLAKDYPFFSCMAADLVAYVVLTEYIKTIPKEKLVFIQDHREAYDIIIKAANGERVDLINIDHHHDIDYSIDGKKDLDKSPDDGDWVGRLYLKDMINNYSWIRNNNSFMPFPWVQEKFPDVDYLYFEKEMLSEIKPDLIVICLSPNWVPKMYHPLYDLWKTI